MHFTKTHTICLVLWFVTLQEEIALQDFNLINCAYFIICIHFFMYIFLCDLIYVIYDNFLACRSYVWKDILNKSNVFYFTNLSKILHAFDLFYELHQKLSCINKSLNARIIRFKPDFSFQKKSLNLIWTYLNGISVMHTYILDIVVCEIVD